MFPSLFSQSRRPGLRVGLVHRNQADLNYIMLYIEGQEICLHPFLQL